jgi:hypothetical protein
MLSVKIASDAIRITFAEEGVEPPAASVPARQRRAAAIASGGARSPDDGSGIAATYREATVRRRRLHRTPVSASDEGSVSDAWQAKSSLRGAGAPQLRVTHAATLRAPRRAALRVQALQGARRPTLHPLSPTCRLPCHVG